MIRQACLAFIVAFFERDPRLQAQLASTYTGVQDVCALSCDVGRIGDQVARSKAIADHACLASRRNPRGSGQRAL